MSTDLRNLQFSQATDTEFRAWTSGISAALQSVGLIQTADTGQINFGTVTKPAGSNTFTGYEIYRLNDSLQSTRPVFIKIEYGAGTATLGAAAVALTVGTASNGAGTLTGLVGSRVVLNMGVSGSTLTSFYPSPVYSSGDTSSIGMMTSYVPSVGAAFAWSFGLFIERSRNTDGTPNGDGLAVVYLNGTSNTLCQFFSFTATALSTVVAYAGIPVQGRFTSYNQGTDLTVFPMIVATPKPQGPSLLVVGCATNEFARTSTQTVVVSGSAHTYVAITGPMGLKSLESNPVGLLMRFE